MDRYRRHRATKTGVPRGLFLILLTLALLWAFPYAEATRNANERPRLLQALALVDEGSLHVDGLAARGINPGPDVARDKHGQLVPNKPPGTTIAAVFGVWASRGWAMVQGIPATMRGLTWWARLFGSILPTLILCWLLVRRYGAAMGLRPTMVAVLLYALGTPAAAYAHLLYGHQLAALALIGGCFLICDARDGGRPDLALLGGAIVGLGLLVEYGMLFVAVPIGVLLLAGVGRRRGPQVVMAALFGALVSVVLLGAYHAVVFGSPWTTGYHHVIHAEFAALHGQGLLGLGWPTWTGFQTHWLEMGGGLLWWVPLVLPGLYGLGLVAFGVSSHRSEARLFLALFLVYAVVAAGLSFDGGWRIGPRYMVAVLPVLVPGWAELLRRWGRTNGWVLAFATLGTYQLVINVLAATLWPHIDLENVRQPVSEVLLPLLGQGLEPYGIPHRLGWGGPDGWAVTAVMGVAIALLPFLLVLVASRENVPAAAAGAMMGLLLVAVTQALPRHPRGAQNLAYIMRVWEPKEVAGHSLELGPVPRHAPLRVHGPVEVIPEPPREGRSSRPSPDGR